MKSQREVDEAIQKQPTHVENQCTFPLIPATAETLAALKVGDWIKEYTSSELLSVTVIGKTGNIDARDVFGHNFTVPRTSIQTIVKEGSIRDEKHAARFFIDTQDPRFTAIAEEVGSHFDVTVYCNGYWQALYEDGTHTYPVTREEDLLAYVRAAIRLIKAKKNWLSVCCQLSCHGKV